MQVNIRCRPSYAMAYLLLAHDEVVYVERGAMAAMSTGVEVRGSLGGEGIVRAVKRRAFGGETLLFSEFHSQYEGAWVAVSPPYPGDVETVDISPENPLLLESGALLAYSKGVVGDVRYTGLKTIVMHEGIALIELSGTGQAVISSYGGIEEFELAPGEDIIIDTGHIVGFSADMAFDVGPLGSVSRSITSGEGIVARLVGPGRVYIQTRAEKELRSWLFPDHLQNEQH